MNLINKSNMAYKSYSWKKLEEGDPKISGKLDYTLFDKKNGHEMLYILNELVRIWKLEDRHSIRKIETMIYKSLPKEKVEQEEIKNWIRDNWDYY